MKGLKKIFWLLALMLLLGACSNRQASVFTQGPNVNFPPTDGGGPSGNPDPGDESPPPNPGTQPAPLEVQLKGRISSVGIYQTNSITALPSQGIDLFWTIDGSPESCETTGFSATINLSGSKSVTPANTTHGSSNVYSIECTQDGDTKSSSFTVNIEEPFFVDIRGRKENDGNFSDTLVTIAQGDNIELEWDVTGAPDSCSTTGFTFDVLSATTTTISNITGADSQSFSYTIECTKGGQQLTDTFYIVLDGPPPVADITITPTGSYNFADTEVGSDRQTSFTIRNTGTIAISGLALFSVASPFSTSGFSDCTSGLAVNATCSFEVDFSPTAAGPYVASLLVEFSEGGSPAGTRLISLSGLATDPPPVCPVPIANVVTGLQGPFLDCPTGISQSACNADWTGGGSQGPVKVFEGLLPGHRIAFENVSGTINAGTLGGTTFYSNCRNGWDGPDSEVSNRPQLILIAQFTNDQDEVVAPPFSTPSNKGAIHVRDFVGEGIEVPAGATRLWVSFPDTIHTGNIGSCTFEAHLRGNGCDDD